MKKVAVITQEKDAESNIVQLRRLGVLHIEHQQTPVGKDITILQDELALVNEALNIISQKELVQEAKQIEQKELVDWKFCAKHIIDLNKRIDQLEEYGRGLIHSISEWGEWGDFNPQEIHSLRQKNIFVRLYQIPEKELFYFAYGSKQQCMLRSNTHIRIIAPKPAMKMDGRRRIASLPQDLVVKKIFSAGGIANCVIISKTLFEIPFKETALPKTGLGQMKKRLAEDNQIINSLKNELVKNVSYRKGLLEAKSVKEKELEFHQALKGMGQSANLAYAVGYAPFNIIGQVTDLAKKEKWGYNISEPSQDDNVPVLLRNPKWVSIINPVYKLMEVVPGYREFDVSPIFLLFLSLFFGMIIGDAGYGAIYFGLTFLAQYKLGKNIHPVRDRTPMASDGCLRQPISNGVKDKSVFFLFYLFSFCAIIWGLLTGTVFGQQWYLSAGFKALAPVLNNAKFIMSFCFLLGAIQLSLAHSWQALVKLPSLAALADIGFICLLWAGFFLAKMFIVGDPFPFYGRWLIWAGIFLVMFFSNPQRNILKSAAQGLGVLALGIMGNFGDVVSYIRLFAVGLAGVAVADSVNTLAAGASGNIIAQVLILFAGHSINIVLGPMSVLVHGIRLNVLEFALLHGNITWSGLAYKPLRE